MLQQALQKIQAEIATAPKDEYVRYIGGCLISHVKTNPLDADKILTEGKTIVGSLAAMKSAAEKKKTGNMAMLTPDAGLAIVLKYYGVQVHQPEPVAVAPSFDVSLDDLL